MADRLGLQVADWAVLANSYGDAIAPFTGLAPPGGPAYAVWQRQVAVDALGHLGTLQEITSFDLPFLLVKGLAWGAAYWGNAFARPAHDLDLVVLRDHDAAWQSRLAEAGFEQATSPQVWGRGRQRVQLHGLDLAPHWLNRVQPPWAAFWDRSSLQPLEHLQVRQLDAADTLLYLAHHQVFRHAYDHDYGWIDLAGWVRQSSPSDVEFAWQRAGGNHLRQALAGLSWAWRQYWELPGLDLPAPSPWVRPWLQLALRRPHPLVGPMIGLTMANQEERRSLLAGLPTAWQRWRQWGRTPHTP